MKNIVRLTVLEGFFEFGDFEYISEIMYFVVLESVCFAIFFYSVDCLGWSRDEVESCWFKVRVLFIRYDEKIEIIVV